VQSVPGSLRVLSRSSVPGHDRSRELRSVTMSGKLRQRRGYLRVTAIDRVQIPIRRSWGRVPKPPHQGGAASGAAGPASAPRAQPWEARPEPTPDPRPSKHTDRDGSNEHRPSCRGPLPRSRLSSSRPPRLGRPLGVASRWLRQPRPGTHSPGFGAYEEEGGELAAAWSGAGDSGWVTRPTIFRLSDGNRRRHDTRGGRDR
jgi:hypothetical protein